MEKKNRQIVRLFESHRVMDMNSLIKATKRGRRSLFRDLSMFNYLSSYTHAGRYYTIPEIPKFDKNGLWFFNSVGFTQAITLKSAVTNFVEKAKSGLTHSELQALLHTRAHNTLLGLVREKKIGREKVEKEYVYTSPHEKRASEQIVERTAHAIISSGVKADTPDAITMEVLLELVYAGKVTVAPKTISKRLAIRSVIVSEQQVKQVYEQFGIDWSKKNPV